jgi:hypothetical protein
MLLAALLLTLAALARSVLLLVRRRGLAEVSREIERATGSSRNTLATFAEWTESAEARPGGAYMLARLEGQARLELEQLDERIAVPRQGAIRGAAGLALMLLFLFALSLLAPVAFRREVRRVVRLATDERAAQGSGAGDASASAGDAEDAIVLEELRVRVVPPAYSGLGVEDVQGDAPVRVLAGSRIEVTLQARGTVEGATLSFNGSTDAMRAFGQGRFGAAFNASTSGAFEARLLAAERLAPAPLVRALEVYGDALPEAHLVEPASDQLLRAVPDAPVVVRWTARDDLGLAGVALKYIKSRGEGDAAKFTNGEASAGTIERLSAREWRGAAALELRRLGMQPGDTLVFWLEARDRNPAANNTGRSAGLAIAIAAPAPARLDLGDLLPNEIGRFLLSERQIIIRTEKLHAARARLSRDELLRQSNEIAAEQREFKNSFNDYIKVEGAGEEAQSGDGEKPASVEERVRAAEDGRTAPHYHGIPEPPAGSAASVREMVYAIRAMWDAEEALSTGETAGALEREREALARLKRAQAAVRYVPPIVARSQPVDLKRRYAGELAEIKTRLEKLSRRPASKEEVVLRAALADAYAALGDLQETLGVPAGVRQGATARARQRARQAADRLIALQGGDHAATIAEAAGQLRIVETELGQAETGGSADEFAARMARPLALLARAASDLFAIAESRTRATGGDAGSLLPASDAEAADYFRRLLKSR